MNTHTNLILFGDETYDFVPKLEELTSESDDPILSAFLDQAYYVLRAQMMHWLPPTTHKLARNSTLVEMLRKHRAGQLPVSLQTALCCMTQLGCFMR